MLGIRIRDLRRTYRLKSREVHALNGISLDVPPASLVAIVGYSGSGKTTLLRHVAALEAPDEGSISFHDEHGTPIPLGRIGMVFQEPRLLPWKTVRDNVLLATHRLPGDPAAHARAVDEAIELVGLTAFAEAKPDQLSGGMAQRTALARALCRDPDLLLMDEPFGALDALTRTNLQGELARVRRARPVTTVFITHDVAEAVRLADKVLVMAEGRIAGETAVPLPHPRDPADRGLGRYGATVLASILGTTPSSNQPRSADR